MIGFLKLQAEVLPTGHESRRSGAQELNEEEMLLLIGKRVIGVQTHRGARRNLELEQSPLVMGGHVGITHLFMFRLELQLVHNINLVRVY